MKQTIFFLMAVIAITNCYAQKANVTWGDEFKLKKGSTDLQVVHTDNTGIYVKESHMALKGYFVIAATTRESASLIKLDKNLTEVYHNDFNKELKGKEYETMFFIKDKLFLLASDYSRKEKTLTLFGAEIDKATGELSGDWQEITAWQKDDKKEDIDFKATYNGDSSRLVLVSTIEGREKNNYEVREFDLKLKAVGKPIKITNEFDPKTFQLEDVLYTTAGNVVMVGRRYEYQEGKKKKAKFLDFTNYNVRIYNGEGNMVKEINTDIDNKWLISSKVLQIPSKELVLAAFYSDTKKGKEVNGMLVQRIDAQTGELISSNKQNVNTSMIDAIIADDDKGDDNDDDESKKERKEREKLEKIQNEEDGFSKYMKFRDFIYTADKGLVILAEKYDTYSYTTTTYESGMGTMGGRTRTTTYQVYECGDLLMSKIDSKGAISWLHILPKQQREVIQTGSGTGPSNGFSISSNFFYGGFNWPFYAGMGVLSNNNTVSIIFNDNRKNDKVLQLGQKVKTISAYGKSDCFTVTLDAITGKYTRSVLFNNKPVPTAMPRLGSVLGKDFYMIGKEDKVFGKTKIAVAKISLN
jgi:hypothetical protein